MDHEKKTLLGRIPLILPMPILMVAIVMLASKRPYGEVLLVVGIALLVVGIVAWRGGNKPQS